MNNVSEYNRILKVKRYKAVLYGEADFIIPRNIPANSPDNFLEATTLFVSFPDVNFATSVSSVMPTGAARCKQEG